MNKHMLAIIFFTALSSTMINASSDRVILSCDIKYGSLSTFTMSFENPKNNNFSIPIKISSSIGENTGTMSGSVENTPTRLNGYFMLYINTMDDCGPVVLDLVASPNFEHAFGYGLNNKMESLLINCKKD